MTEAPQQLHLWKKHFDKWANKRMAQVLSEDTSMDAKAAFDSFLSELQDSDVMDTLVDAFD